MESLIIVVHVLSAVAITGLVLIQHGKGADMGASFGSGASQTIFGSVGTGNALTKSTTWMAVLFFITSLTLAVMARQQADQTIEGSSLIQNPNAVMETQNANGNAEANALPELPADAAPATEAPAEAETAVEQPAETDAVPEETVEPQPETSEN
jgi:preprotein translocase subunit SecG